jgi:hypothetical protein
MKRVSPYLKMQVLAAIDYAEGKSRFERIRKVAAMEFKDEDGNVRQFTWRTCNLPRSYHKIRIIFPHYHRKKTFQVHL